MFCFSFCGRFGHKYSSLQLSDCSVVWINNCTHCKTGEMARLVWFPLCALVNLNVSVRFTRKSQSEIGIVLTLSSLKYEIMVRKILEIELFYYRLHSRWFKKKNIACVFMLHQGFIVIYWSPLVFVFCIAFLIFLYFLLIKKKIIN